MTEEELELLNLLHPTLRPYVRVLLTHEFGLLKDSPKIHSIQCGSIIKKNELQYGDRFHLRLLYCRKPLNWQVLMNGNDITVAPDFIMEENFLASETEDSIKLKVPSLINWDPTDIRCLLNVVLELLQVYKSYQINLLRLNPRLQRYLFEFDSLLSMTELKEQEIEVCVQNASRGIIIMFLIQLNVDFTRLPTALPSCKNLIVLVIEFKDNVKTTIQLIPRIELEGSLGGPLDIPDLPPDTSLIDYVPEIENQLQERVERVINFTYQRKILYSYLVQFLEPALINGDSINFKNVSFLLEQNNFYCVLNIHIPQTYPESPPTFQLLPFQKATNPRASEYNNYPYNEDMTHEELAKSIFAFVRETAIAEFQKNTV
ncbi:hypothetical protein RUM44_008941 [Polyplax serrata]|uniref:BRISC and BRCA1-A complex member 2 n=1 Tax=Polyplax serrata TaxID=468196 RepID=A0ABR1ASS7_POLSC